MGVENKMFKNKLEQKIIELKKSFQELTDFVFLCIDNLPRDVKDKQINEYLTVSLENCPNLVKYLFIRLYNANADEDSVSTYLERENKWVEIGTPKDTLEKLINSYLYEHEKRGSLYLTCPNCQERFLLECTTEEDYSYVCQKCGKYLKLKVTSKTINISVGG